MSLLDASVAVLNAGLKSVGGVTVTYRRGNESITELVAVPLATRHDEYGGEEVLLTARDRDWLVWQADLVLAGTPWIPQRGDEIDWLDANEIKHTFQILPRSGDRCYRHTDQTLQQLRVYTVESLPSTE